MFSIETQYFKNRRLENWPLKNRRLKSRHLNCWENLDCLKMIFWHFKTYVATVLITILSRFLIKDIPTVETNFSKLIFPKLILLNFFLLNLYLLIVLNLYLLNLYLLSLYLRSLYLVNLYLLNLYLLILNFFFSLSDDLFLDLLVFLARADNLQDLTMHFSAEANQMNRLISFNNPGVNVRGRGSLPYGVSTLGGLYHMGLQTNLVR